VRETVAYILPQAVRIGILQEFYKNDIFLTAPFVVHIWTTFLEI
jgi:hypothetical protein